MDITAIEEDEQEIKEEERKYEYPLIPGQDFLKMEDPTFGGG